MSTGKNTITLDYLNEGFILHRRNGAAATMLAHALFAAVAILTVAAGTWVSILQSI